MGRPRLHDDAVRSRLLEAASTVLAQDGVAGLTVRDVAARAGTSTSAVYSLFGGRPELVRAVGDEAFARFADRLAAVPRTDDPEADLLALGLAYRRYARDEPHFYRAMFGTPGAGAQDGSHGPMTQAPTFLVLRDAVADRGEPGGAGDVRRPPPCRCDEQRVHLYPGCQPEPLTARGSIDTNDLAAIGRAA